MAFHLPDFITIRTTRFPDRGLLYYNEGGRTVTLGEQSAFSTLVKIEVERATSNANQVHLRFSNSNRYWSKSANSNVIVAELKQPVEDTTDPSCTLFQAVRPGQEADVFNLTHVQTGQRLYLNSANWGLVVQSWGQDNLRFVDWSTLVKLPAHVAFKGDNDSFLRGVSQDGYNYLQFSSVDPNELASGHRVSFIPDGHVRITSDHWGGQFWRRSPNWIWADANQSSIDNPDTHFWLIRIDGDTIAFRNAGNGNFCSRRTTEGKTSMLNAAFSTIVNEARLVVQELVSRRHITNVRYRMEDARIFGEMPYLGGTSMLTNTTDEESDMAVEVTYQDEKSYTFSRSMSITAGVSTTFQTGVPFIVEGKITASFEINTTLQWDTATTTTTSLTASGSVPVPARSIATIEYVGTRGTCDIPYSYTQQDWSSTSGLPAYTEQVDGTYRGVSCYNFNFVVRSTRSLIA
ncbi:uncharacterized protein LOC125204364 isoform X2 [Salvia hispanica]|nr:uncharacterized protein LOC125204364 isoform X2 [Salvia hispanica]